MKSNIRSSVSWFKEIGFGYVHIIPNIGLVTNVHEYDGIIYSRYFVLSLIVYKYIIINITIDIERNQIN